MATIIKTIDGKEVTLLGVNAIGHAQFIAGKMKRPDTLSFSHSKEGIIIMGLWRGRPTYGQCKVAPDTLLNGLIQAGCTKDAEHLKECLQAWQ